MSRLSAGKKLIFWVITIGIFFILLEVFLRLAGFVYKSFRDPPQKSPKLAQEMSILCVGDSYTFGAGADAGASYPEQLEQLLRKAGIPARVINEGVCASNSSMVMRTLPDRMRRFKPDLVMVMAGLNDDWNFEGSNYYLFINSKDSLLYRKIDIFLSNFKIYKCFKVLEFGIRSRLAALKIKNYVFQVKARENAVLRPQDEEKLKGYLTSAQAYWNNRERASGPAVEKINQCLAIDPQNKEALFLLADIYKCSGQDNLGKAIETYKRIIDLYPEEEGAHKALFEVYYRKGDALSAYEEAKAIVSLDPGNATFIRILAMGVPFFRDSQMFAALLDYNIGSIVLSARSQGRGIVLLTYPHPGAFVNNLVKKAAEKYNVPLVDNDNVFQEIQSAEGYSKAEYFVPDGHCTNKGYKVVAENALKVIKGLWAKETFLR